METPSMNEVGRTEGAKGRRWFKAAKDARVFNAPKAVVKFVMKPALYL